MRAKCNVPLIWQSNYRKLEQKFLRGRQHGGTNCCQHSSDMKSLTYERAAFLLFKEARATDKDR